MAADFRQKICILKEKALPLFPILEKNKLNNYNKMKANKFYLIICTALLMLGNGAASAEEYIFDRLAVGVEVGTAGAGLELASPVTRFVTLRAGVSALPELIGKSFTIPYSVKNIQYSAIVKGSLHKIDGKVLADIYPFPESSFHLTTGLYMGTADFIRAQNTTELKGIGKGEGIMVGGKAVTLDENGKVRLSVQAASMKPYVGVGFGRPVSDHHLNLALDLGVQYWGAITLNAWSPDEEEWASITPDDINNAEFKKYYDIISGIPVYPVLNLRLYYCF